MAKSNKQLNEIMQLRVDAMEFALKLAETQGLDALRKEIIVRRTTQIPLEISKEFINGIISNMYAKIINCYNASVYKTLHELFGFGKLRLHRFDDAFNETIKDLSTVDGYGQMLYTFTDIAKEYNEKYEMGINMDAVRDGDENNQRALGAGKVDISYVAETLRRHEYFEAAQLLEDITGV